MCFYEIFLVRFKIALKKIPTHLTTIYKFKVLRFFIACTCKIIWTTSLPMYLSIGAFVYHWNHSLFGLFNDFEALIVGENKEKSLLQFFGVLFFLDKFTFGVWKLKSLHIKHALQCL
jgi:hypothetical protein